MPGIPQIVLERLRAKSAALATSGPAAGPANSQGGEHPDANLLAAFVEKALTTRERTEVLNHLAQCAACREVVALTLPEEADVAYPLRFPTRRWSGWPVLRWGTLAAVLGAVAIIVVLHQYPSRKQAMISKDMHPAVVPGAGETTPQIALRPAQPSAEAVAAKSQAEARESLREMAKLEVGAARSGGRNVAPQPAGAETKQQVTLMAAARQPAAMEAENAPPVPAERGTSRTEGALTVGAMPAAPPPAKPAFKVSAAESEPQAETSVVPQPSGVTATMKTEAATASSNLNADQVRASSRKTMAASAPRVAAQMRAEPQAQELASVAARSGFKGRMGPPVALWRISASGKVERSEDGEKTWEEVQIDSAVIFRAITASGGDVWAGGSGGALYHSTDDGANWQRVKLESGGTSLAETIIGILVRDPQHLTVTTASGEQWMTEDGGLHWQKEP